MNIPLFRNMRHLPMLWWTATLVVSLCAGYLVFTSVSRSAASAAKYSDSVEVLVATRDLSAGQALSTDDYERQRRPIAFVPAGRMEQSNPEARITSTNIGQGEVLLSSDIAPGGSGPIAALLRANERAVEIETGRLKLEVIPGDRVDVIATVDSDRSTEALILSRSARVLTVSNESIAVAVPQVETAAVAASASQRRLTVALSSPVND